MKKIILLLLITALIAAVLAGCSNQGAVFDISGLIKDTEGFVLIGADVYSGETKLGTTNGNGFVQFESRMEGSVAEFMNALEIRHENIESYELTFTFEKTDVIFNVIVELKEAADINRPEPSLPSEEIPASIKKTIIGVAKDTKYDTLANVDIYFSGEHAARSASDGSFSFDIADAARWDADKICDLMEVKYMNKPFSIKCKSWGNTNQIECFAFVEVENTGAYLYGKLTTFFFKTTFGNNDVVLPPGYLTRGEIFVNGGLSVEGDMTLVGVKIYFKDTLIGESNEYGVDIVDILPGTVLRFEKNGFTFHVIADGGYTRLENDEITVFEGMSGGLFDIRARTDNLNVLMEG